MKTKGNLESDQHQSRKITLGIKNHLNKEEWKSLVLKNKISSNIFQSLQTFCKKAKKETTKPCKKTEYKEKPSHSL